MPKDERDVSLDDELARIRASFLKAAAAAAAAAAPTSAVTAPAGFREDVFSSRPATAQLHGGGPSQPRPYSASARPHPSAAESSRNNELYQVYVGSLKQIRSRKKCAAAASHVAVRMPVTNWKSGTDAEDDGIEEDTGHEEDDRVDDSIEKIVSKAASSSGRSRRVTSAPLSRSSLHSSYKSSADAAPDVATLSAGQAQAPKPSHEVSFARVLKSRPASASQAQRASADSSSRQQKLLSVSQLQRSHHAPSDPHGDGGAAASKKSESRSFVPSVNPYFPTDSDACASRPRPNPESFLARVAAAAERTGGVNDALQLSMMRKRGEGRNVYVTDGSCPDLKACMESRGWHLNPSPSSALFDLRWTLQEADSDILTLQPGQINNHFPQNHVLTTKVGLLKSLRGLRWSADCDEETFFPRAYDLSDPAQKEDWIDDFKFCATTSVIELVSKMHICSIHAGNLLHHACVAGRSVVRMTLSEAYRHISTRSDTNFLNPVPLSITELDDDAWASIHSLRRSLLTSHWAASEAGSFIRIELENQEGDRPIDSCRECRKMLGANASINSCAADSADHVDIVSRCCQVYDSLKEFCPQRSLLGAAACWIVKPNCSSRGVGVRLTDDMLELAAGKSEGRVVQKYIERPLLINGKKFDLRVWVLVTSWAPLVIWVFPECLARFCSHPFSLNELGNKYRHLTNVSINKSAATGGDITWSAEDIKEAVDAQFSAGFWESEVWPQVVRTCSLAFISAQGVIDQQDNCFELFGCDVALDSQGRPWLLEVNTSPDLRHSTPSKKAITPTLVEDTMKLIIDIGLSTIAQELSRSYGLRKPSPPLEDIGRVFLDPPSHWQVGLWQLAYVGFMPPSSNICSQATLLSINGSKISGKMALRMAAVAGAAEHAAAAIFSACVLKRGIARRYYSERHYTTLFLQSKLRRSFVYNLMQDLRLQAQTLQGCVRRRNLTHFSARLFASLTLTTYMRRIIAQRKVSFSYAQELLARFVRMNIERNWIIRWFRNESVVRRVFLGMVSRYFVKKAREIMDHGIPDSIATITRLVIQDNGRSGAPDIAALIAAFKARAVAIKEAKILNANVRRTLERNRFVDEVCARKIVSACLRYHSRRNYSVQLISSHIAALLKQLCIRTVYQRRISAGRNLICFAQRKLLNLRHSSTVSAAEVLKSISRRSLVNAAFSRYARAGKRIAPWGAAATVRHKWLLVRASMTIARRLLTSITCWRWKSIYSVAVLKSRLSSWVFRKRFSALRKCARSLQVMCLWLLARRRACIVLQHSFRCHRSRSKIVQLVEQRAKLISKFLRRRKSELINPNFKVVSLHTAKEVSDLYMYTKSAAEIENERRPWRRLKRTALRDAEALAESVFGMPAEDLRRRFRGVIGRRVLVTLSAIADMDECGPELQSMAQDKLVASNTPLPPSAKATSAQAETNQKLAHELHVELSQASPGDSLQLVRSLALLPPVPGTRNQFVLQENCPPPLQEAVLSTQSEAAAGLSQAAAVDARQGSVARYLHLKNQSAVNSFVSDSKYISGQPHQLRPSTSHTSGSGVRLVHHGEDASGMVMPQAAMGVTVRDGRMGTVYKAMEGAKMPNQNLPRVIQLPKQILLHLEATAKTRASISAAISTDPIEQQVLTDLNTLRKVYSQSASGSSNLSHMRAFSASK